MADMQTLASWTFLIATLVGAWFTYNAYRPSYRPPWLAGVSFFAGWLTNELAVHHFAWQAGMTAIFVWAGALDAAPGRVGLAITVVSWIGLAGLFRRAQDADAVVEGALRHAFGQDYQDEILDDVRQELAPGFDWRQVLVPFPLRHPDVERVQGIVYARMSGLNLKLDVYHRRDRPAKRPTLMQIHGGAWVLGSKNEQGLPLMLHLAARGWVCISVNYRLSPHATFPEQLIDLKHAIGWIREHGPEYGADPDFLVVTGGSAGGHLAALTALTANDRELQPGFENVDTSVQGCVAFYGVYDLADRNAVWPHDGMRKLMERQVIKASLSEAPELYEKASPISQLHHEAPPFLVIHGDRDSVVPVNDARHFVTAFRERAHGRIAYAEIPGAQHAFEIFPSSRAMLVIHGVERFLALLYSEHVRASRSVSPAAEPARPLQHLQRA
jgi:acetyl esterase/lipase